MARAALREPAPLVTLVRSLTVENVDSTVILSRYDIHPCDVQVCDLDGVFDARLQDGPMAWKIFSVESCLGPR
jgi:hypothetical protein